MLAPKGAGRVYLEKESMSCCQIRHQKMRMTKGIVEGYIPVSGNHLVRQANNRLKRYKEEFPEEYEYLFGNKIEE